MVGMALIMPILSTPKIIIKTTILILICPGTLKTTPAIPTPVLIQETDHPTSHQRPLNIKDLLPNSHPHLNPNTNSNIKDSRDLDIRLNNKIPKCHNNNPISRGSQGQINIRAKIIKLNPSSNHHRISIRQGRLNGNDFHGLSKNLSSRVMNMGEIRGIHLNEGTIVVEVIVEGEGGVDNLEGKAKVNS